VSETKSLGQNALATPSEAGTAQPSFQDITAAGQQHRAAPEGGEDADKAAPRSPLEIAEYPRQMYRADGHTDIALNEAQMQAMLEQGWSKTFVAPRYPQQAQGTVMASGLDPMAQMLREVLEAVLDERGVGISRAERHQRTHNGPMRWPLGKEQRADG